VRHLTRDAQKASIKHPATENGTDDSGLRLSVDDVIALESERIRQTKNQKEQIRKMREVIKNLEKDNQELRELRKAEESQGREPARWTPEESLSFKIHNLLSDRDYQNIRNSFATVQPLTEARRFFEEVTAHVTLEEIKHPTMKNTLGYKTTLKEVLVDAVNTGNLGIEPDVVNEMKLTGDGGRLSPKYPMTCLFVQSLMLTQDQQGLSSASPLSILTSSES
jgi:hypothetical protein